MTAAHDHQHEWPTVQSSTVIDPHLERDEALNALEKAWQNGSIVENEPRV